MKPHCLATLTGPRFSWLYFSRKPEIETICFSLCEKGDGNHCLIKLLLMLQMMSQTHSECASHPIELMQWKGISAPSRTSKSVFVKMQKKNIHSRYLESRNGRSAIRNSNAENEVGPSGIRNFKSRKSNRSVRVPVRI